MPVIQPVMFRDRSRGGQVVLGVVVPAAVGVLAGVLVGVSAGAYWAVAALAGVGALLGGFEHADGWDAADRGVVGGAVYGTALLLTHEITGATAEVDLGAFPPLLVVVTAIAGMLLSALGGRLARTRRESAAT